MNKQLLTLAFATIMSLGYATVTHAQSGKNKKSRYYQNNEAEQEFNVQGFSTEKEKKEVDKKTVEDEYDVKVSKGESDGKYKGESRIIREADYDTVYGYERKTRTERPVRAKGGYYTSYGTYVPYKESRERYDKYYTTENTIPAPMPAPREPRVIRESRVIREPRVVRTKKVMRTEKEIKMTDDEHEYKTTVVRKRYTNLDVLCDDLDLAKIQRPVFKGICTECSHDVDVIIVNKNMSNLEKNYNLKQCYMLRDKRLRETLDDDQYHKFLRIKDADEYLILTRDPELKDGVNK